MGYSSVVGIHQVNKMIWFCSLLLFQLAQSMTIYNEYNVTSIGCFHCTSIGGDNPACEDPFNSTEAFEKGLYKDNCLAGLKGRGGLYPATACIKFDGYYRSSKENITIRTCTVDSGSKTSDVELIRIPHSCGQTAFLNDGIVGRSKKDIDDEDILKDSDLRIYACINVCNDYGCNHSSNLIHFNLLLITGLICILF